MITDREADKLADQIIATRGEPAAMAEFAREWNRKELRRSRWARRQKLVAKVLGIAVVIGIVSPFLIHFFAWLMGGQPR